MIRPRSLSILISALVLAVCVQVTPLGAQDLMQCMTECVKSEGNDADAKATCKSRCANVAVPQINSGNPPDCMTTYKACNRSCGAGAKSCRQTCKDSLMSCK